VKTTLAIALFGILCAGSATVARAACIGASVNSFGAKGDGQTDYTAAIQGAISATAAAGGGSVVFSVARYFTTGTLVIPRGVVLCGAVEGPFDVAGVNPAVTTIAPTLLITNTSGPFLTLQGTGGGRYSPKYFMGRHSYNDSEKVRSRRSVARHTRHAHPENSDPRRDARLRHPGIPP